MSRDEFVERGEGGDTEGRGDVAKSDANGTESFDLGRAFGTVPVDRREEQKHVGVDERPLRECRMPRAELGASVGTCAPVQDAAR